MKFWIFVAVAFAAMLGSTAYVYHQLAPNEGFNFEVLSLELENGTVQIGGSTQCVVAVRNNGIEATVRIDIEVEPAGGLTPQAKLVTFSGGETRSENFSLEAEAAGNYRVRAVIHRFDAKKWAYIVTRLDPASEWKQMTVLENAA